MPETVQAQPYLYNESDFERVEAERALWYTLEASEGWRTLLRVREGHIAGWRTSLETLSGEMLIRTQGMIVGAKALLAYPADKIRELDALLEQMRDENEGMKRDA